MFQKAILEMKRFLATKNSQIQRDIQWAEWPNLVTKCLLRVPTEPRRSDKGFPFVLPCSIWNSRQFSGKNNFNDFDENFKSIKSETDCYWSEKIPNIIFTTGTCAQSEIFLLVKFCSSLTLRLNSGLILPSMNESKVNFR